MRFFEIMKQQYIILLKISKIQSNVQVYSNFFFQIEALLSLKNAWLSPVFFLDAKSTC